LPVISRFFGIVVRMYYRDHAPPHFHVRYGEFHAVVAIDPPALMHGELPPRALGMVIEWATSHRTDLLEDWQLARQERSLLPIEPLG
jgi:hypothetical protein